MTDARPSDTPTDAAKGLAFTPRQNVEGGQAEAAISALRMRGADRCDPVRFRFIEALARRAAAHRGESRRVLDRALADALAAYAERLDRAEREARDALARGSTRFPEAADLLRQQCEAGDFGGLRRLLAKLEVRGDRGPLAELLAQLAQHGQDAGGGEVVHAGGAASVPQGDLKAVRYFRSTWSKLSLDRQLAHAFAQAPENAGPLNSHFLVLQALRQMRDISPEYLEQFVSYADTLLWLDHADAARNPVQKGPARAERGKKRKSGKSGVD